MIRRLLQRPRYPVRLLKAVLAAGPTTLFLCAATAAAAGGADDAGVEPTAIIGNERVRATFTVENDGIIQRYYARSGAGWALIAESLKPPRPFPAAGSQTYNSQADPRHRLIVTEILSGVAQSDDQRVVLQGRNEAAQVTQTVAFDEQNQCFHIEVAAILNAQPPALDCLWLPLTFVPEGQVDFIHAPAHKRTQNDVLADGVFHAPAVIIQKGETCFALAPDVETIDSWGVHAEHIRRHPDANAFSVPVDASKLKLPAALDCELQSHLTDRPLAAYGLTDHLIRQHVYWERDNAPGAMVRELADSHVRFACDLFVRGDSPPHRGYQEIAQFHWKKSGRKRFGLPRPQAMPFSEYAEVCIPAHLTYKGYDLQGVERALSRQHLDRPDLDSWQQWDLNGQAVGGFRIVAPQWYDFIYNLAWFNNACDATGLYYWGRRLDRPDWVDKARRIVNLSLAAPQHDGIFPALYNVKQKRWILSLWRPPAENYDPHKKIHAWEWENQGSYMPASASTTAGFLLQYRSTCEDDPRILPYVKRYGDFLVKHMKPDGLVPSWFDEDLKPLPSMSEFNADGGIHIWVLAELYRATQDDRYLAAAEKMAEFMLNEVLPQQRWSDFEAFYSCAPKPELFFDAHTGQPARDLMAVYWAMSGMCSLYEATGDQRYLDAAQQAADFAGLFQAVWSPSFMVNCYPFGGMAAQLGDGEWLDQRSHRFTAPLIRTGLLAARQDLIERGVAAARASMSLITHPRNEANDIYKDCPFPLGVGPENATHEGYPQVPLATAASWGSVGGVAAGAHAYQLLGGVYLDFEKDIFVGVDGVRLESAELRGDTISLSIANVLAELPTPFDEPFETTLKIRGLEPARTYDLSINSRVVASATGEELRNYRWKATPDAR